MPIKMPRYKAFYSFLDKEMIPYSRLIRKINVPIFVDSFIYVTDGIFNVHRLSDDVLIDTLTGPWIIGVASLFGDGLPIYVVLKPGCKAYTLAPVLAKRMLVENDMLDFAVGVMVKSLLSLFNHDKIISSRNAYAIVKEILVHHAAKSDEIKKRINIASSIVSQTGLSRSRVMAILSSLRKTGSIVMTNGKLYSISSLPDELQKSQE